MTNKIRIILVFLGLTLLSGCYWLLEDPCEYRPDDSIDMIMNRPYVYTVDGCILW